MQFLSKTGGKGISADTLRALCPAVESPYSVSVPSALPKWRNISAAERSTRNYSSRPQSKNHIEYIIYIYILSIFTFIAKRFVQFAVFTKKSCI